ncbi:MAG: hypothetical protein V4754_03405 [Pseudomonadota bacterium]
MKPRIARAIAQLGYLDAGLYALGQVLARASGGRWALYKYRFVAQKVAETALSGGRGRGIEVRLCRHPDQLPQPYPRRPEVLAQRHLQGARSLAACKDGRLVGFLWLLSGGYLEDEVRVRYRLLSPQSAWDFDVWVRPEERLGLTFARLWDEANRLLREQSVRWSCSRISAFNAASLGAHASIGTVGIGSAVFLRCGRWQWMLASLAPYVHLSRGPASLPELRFDTSGLSHPPSMEPPCATSNK